MFAMRRGRAPIFPLMIGAILGLMGPGGLFAQEARNPSAPRLQVQPYIQQIPPPRLGIIAGNFDNGRVCGVRVLRADPSSPAACVRVRRHLPNGSFVYGPPTTLIPGDILTWVVERGTGRSWRIRNHNDLGRAMRSLAPGQEILISGYDADNRYRYFVARVKLESPRPPGEGPPFEDQQVPPLDETLPKSAPAPMAPVRPSPSSEDVPSVVIPDSPDEEAPPAPPAPSSNEAPKESQEVPYL